ncbi:EamA/RhaT family transporter [Streptomyces sp. SID1328]|uniref:EamA/RhaT family transporter n=1 Tax=Streptomyces sp. SID1328 TaxID=2690250 RepID=UPI0013683BF0|nr:EamA/RhaT family transporter [Streptomyces sp. SID1328]
MSDETGTDTTPAGSTGGPRPEPLRFFGTTWVDHTGGYAVRRAAVALVALAAAAVSCLILRLAYQGLQIAGTGSFVTVLVIVMFAVCSALAFRTTWDNFGRRPDPERQARLRGLLAVGFVGTLLAWSARSLTEAPGEKLHRTEYDTARAEYERTQSRRTGNPAKARKKRRA